jgi:hypothetical protein
MGGRKGNWHTSEPNIGASELAKKLKAEYKVTTRYHTIWRCKERAMEKLYGTWGQCFQNLVNFKAEIEKRSPGSILEVDVKRERGKVYFRRFLPCKHLHGSIKDKYTNVTCHWIGI